MPDILDAIMARRSIRKYTDEPVSREAIDTLLQAAMAAPSASNRRPWEFVVVTEAEGLRRLKAGLPLARYNAPVAICVCGDIRRAYPPPAREFWVQDCATAAENILLAATAMGLGSCWVGVYPVPPFVAWVRRALHLPAHVIPMGVLYVGHPAQRKPARTQYDPTRVRWEVYGPPVSGGRRWWQFWRRPTAAPEEPASEEGAGQPLP